MITTTYFRYPTLSKFEFSFCLITFKRQSIEFFAKILIVHVLYDVVEAFDDIYFELAPFSGAMGIQFTVLGMWNIPNIPTLFKSNVWIYIILYGCMMECAIYGGAKFHRSIFMCGEIRYSESSTHKCTRCIIYYGWIWWIAWWSLSI